MSNTMMKTGTPGHYNYGRQASNRALRGAHSLMAFLA